MKSTIPGPRPVWLDNNHARSTSPVPPETPKRSGTSPRKQRFVVFPDKEPQHDISSFSGVTTKDLLVALSEAYKTLPEHLKEIKQPEDKTNEPELKAYRVMNSLKKFVKLTNQPHILKSAATIKVSIESEKIRQTATSTEVCAFVLDLHSSSDDQAPGTREVVKDILLTRGEVADFADDSYTAGYDGKVILKRIYYLLAKVKDYSELSGKKVDLLSSFMTHLLQGQPNGGMRSEKVSYTLDDDSSKSAGELPDLQYFSESDPDSRKLTQTQLCEDNSPNKPQPSSQEEHCSSHVALYNKVMQELSVQQKKAARMETKLSEVQKKTAGLEAESLRNNKRLDEHDKALANLNQKLDSFLPNLQKAVKEQNNKIKALKKDFKEITIQHNVNAAEIKLQTQKQKQLQMDMVKQALVASKLSIIEKLVEQAKKAPSQMVFAALANITHAVGNAVVPNFEEHVREIKAVASSLAKASGFVYDHFSEANQLRIDKGIAGCRERIMQSSANQLAKRSSLLSLIDTFISHDGGCESTSEALYKLLCETTDSEGKQVERFAMKVAMLEPLCVLYKSSTQDVSLADTLKVIRSNFKKVESAAGRVADKANKVTEAVLGTRDKIAQAVSEGGELVNGVMPEPSKKAGVLTSWYEYLTRAAVSFDDGMSKFLRKIQQGSGEIDAYLKILDPLIEMAELQAGLSAGAEANKAEHAGELLSGGTANEVVRPVSPPSSPPREKSQRRDPLSPRSNSLFSGAPAESGRGSRRLGQENKQPNQPGQNNKPFSPNTPPRLQRHSSGRRAAWGK